MYEFRFVWTQKDVGEKRGTIRTRWNANCLLEDFSGKNHENIVNLNPSILMMSSSEYLFFESECSFTKYVSSCPLYQIFVSTVTVFQNEGVSDNTYESVFNFWWNMVV